MQCVVCFGYALAAQHQIVFSNSPLLSKTAVAHCLTCRHLGLPLVGRTALLQGKVADKCIVCPAHGTAFDLGTGEVKGKW